MKSRRETLEEFISQDPADSFARYALALELEKDGQAGEAIVQLREVLNRDESYVAAYYHLGRLLALGGETEEARTAYAKGLEAAISAGDQRTRSEIQQALEML